jgi:hypothetical protein
VQWYILDKVMITWYACETDKSAGSSRAGQITIYCNLQAGTATTVKAAHTYTHTCTYSVAWLASHYARSMAASSFEKYLHLLQPVRHCLSSGCTDKPTLLGGRAANFNRSSSSSSAEITFHPLLTGFGHVESGPPHPPPLTRLSSQRQHRQQPLRAVSISQSCKAFLKFNVSCNLHAALFRMPFPDAFLTIAAAALCMLLLSLVLVLLLLAAEAVTAELLYCDSCRRCRRFVHAIYNV